MKPDSSLHALISLLMMAILVLILVWFIARVDVSHAPVMRMQQAASVSTEPVDELTMRFQQAAMMLHAKEYEHAVTALHRVLALSPRMPEAHVNMGYALLGLNKFDAALRFFMRASDLQPYQGNAYWGLAIVYEQLGDVQAALGAMRTYIHLAEPGDPFVRKARSALWEWDNQLKRGPLPEAERQFLDKGRKQWEDRNSPARDGQVEPLRELNVRSLME